MKLFITSFFLLFVVSTSAWSAQEADQAGEIVADVKDVSSSKEVLYKELYSVSVKANEDMVTSIQWSIGVVATFLIALFGSQVFYNFRVSKKEIEKLQANIDEHIIQKTSEMNREFDQLKAELVAKVVEDNQVLERESNDKIESILKEKTEQLTKSTSQNVEELSLLVNTKLNQLNYKVSVVNKNVWELKNVEANVLSSYVDILEFEKKLPSSDLSTLNGILKTLDQSKEVNKDTKQKLEASLADYTKQDEMKKKILAKLATLKVYEFVEDSNGKLHFVYPS